MEIDWQTVSKVLFVRLRSIGDTVLTTPSLIELKRLLPDAQIDILLEDWVAPVLEGFEYCDNVIAYDRSTAGKIAVARSIRRAKYDVVFNMHGGSTSGLFTLATGARYRIGYQNYRNGFFYTHRVPPSSQYWNRADTHSAEQQIALLGHAGLDIRECPETSLTVSEKARLSVAAILDDALKVDADTEIAVIHPAAAYETKQWPAERFASAVECIKNRNIEPIIVTTEAERHISASIEKEYGMPVANLSQLSLPEVTALIAKASLFVGNDSGIAHIAAAVKTPSVVIFGSSNRVHWKPWTKSINRIVFHPLVCQPCPGDYCREYDEPKCILGIGEPAVISALEEVIAKSRGGGEFTAS